MSLRLGLTCAFTMSLRSVEDVAVYLRRHGVSVGAKAFLCSKRSVADELLRFAKDGNANLIVAGAYGHSRLGEWMFGGVTRWPRAISAACSRTEAETGERFNNDEIAAKQPAWPDGDALGRKVGRAISLSWMRRGPIHDPRRDQRNGHGHHD